MTMDQAVWAMIGLLAATLFGMFFHLGGKIDSINARIDSTNDGMNTLGARLDARIDGTNDRIDVTNERLDATNERINELGARLESRIDAFTGLLQTHIEHHTT